MKIYLRNHLKIAKILHLNKHINSQVLFNHASDNYGLPIENISLYYACMLRSIIHFLYPENIFLCSYTNVFYIHFKHGLLSRKQQFQ